MSSAVTSRSLPTIECVSRLIPGHATAKALGRKPPRSQAFSTEGASREQTQSAPRRRSLNLSIRRDLLLPAPVVTGSRWELCKAVARDYSAIFVSGFLALQVNWLVRCRLLAGSWLRISPEFLGAARFRSICGFAVMATLLGYSEGLYRHGFRRLSKQEAAVLAKAVGWAGFLTGVVAWPIGASASEIWSLLLVVSSCFVGLWLVRSLSARTRVEGMRDRAAHNVLIVGAGPLGREVADYLRTHPECGRVVRGFLDDSSVPSFGVLGAPENLAAVARAEFADEIILAAPHRGELARTVIRDAHRNHLDVTIVPELFGHEARDLWIETAGAIPLLTLHREELPFAGLFAKRVMDALISVGVLVATAPMMAVIAILIRLDSPGPALYTAVRVGKKGRNFRCYKFRTMSARADELREGLRARNQREGPCFKIVDDPRITRLGRWLRRYSLDEFPQLWNVLRGEMSLVGPRPHPVDDVARYELDHLRRLDVTPGITGLWQVMARKSASFRTNIALDLEYIERWSLWMDVRILLKTFTVVFQGTGD